MPMRVAGWSAAVVLAVCVYGAVEAKEKTRLADLDGWMGQWAASDEQSLEIAPGAGETLTIEGFATWGMHDPERVERGGVNMGEFYAAVPTGWVADGRVEFAVGDGRAYRAQITEAQDCALRMELQGETLLVEDNGLCGGMNVRFDGAYRRE
jgi:hypothetical protein